MNAARSDWTEGEYLREIARLTRQRDEWNILGRSDWDSDDDLGRQIADLEGELEVLQNPELFDAPVATRRAA